MGAGFGLVIEAEVVLGFGSVVQLVFWAYQDAYAQMVAVGGLCWACQDAYAQRVPASHNKGVKCLQNFINSELKNKLTTGGGCWRALLGLPGRLLPEGGA